MTEHNLVLLNETGGVAVVTLNRPERLQRAEPSPESRYR